MFSIPVVIGLHYNGGKSQVFLTGVDQLSGQTLEILGMDLGAFLIKYSGCPWWGQGY